MKIAFDIDDTIYDTDRVSKILLDVAREEAKGKVFEDRATELGYIFALYNRLRENSDVWFMPCCVMQENVAELEKFRDTHEDIHLCILTARIQELYLYHKMLSETNINISDDEIYQGEQGKTKAMLCVENDIDVLIDDSMSNLKEHISYARENENYNTLYILYKNPKLEKLGFYTELSKMSNMSNVKIMQDWSELEGILSQR